MTKLKNIWMKVKVWQCGTRYREKGVPGCGSDNLFEKDLFRGFVYAWNAVVENRDEYLARWEQKLAEGDPLQKHRAKQMMELTAAGTITEIDLALVGKVLDRCVAHPLNVLDFYFLDGTTMGVSAAD